MKIKINSWKVKDVFEIKIDIKSWLKIMKLKETNNITYSWVVRLCLFRFINDEEIREGLVLKIQKKISEKYTNLKPNKLHRHRLCLHGSDADLVRVTAQKYGLSITKLVQISIYLYLMDIQAENYSQIDLVKLGTKIIKNFKIVNIFEKSILIVKFQDSEYWLGKYLTNTAITRAG